MHGAALAVGMAGGRSLVVMREVVGCGRGSAARAVEACVAHWGLAGSIGEVWKL